MRATRSVAVVTCRVSPAMAVRRRWSPRSSATCCPPACQRRASLFSPTVATRAPSALTATPATGPPWAYCVTTCPSARRIRRATPSAQPVSTSPPSPGKRATAVTAPPWTGFWLSPAIDRPATTCQRQAPSAAVDSTHWAPSGPALPPPPATTQARCVTGWAWLVNRWRSTPVVVSWIITVGLPAATAVTIRVRSSDQASAVTSPPRLPIPWIPKAAPPACQRRNDPSAPPVAKDCSSATASVRIATPWPAVNTPCPVST